MSIEGFSEIKAAAVATEVLPEILEICYKYLQKRGEITQ